MSEPVSPSPSPTAALRSLWLSLALPADDLARVQGLDAPAPSRDGFASRFAIGEAAQAAVAAATLAASSLGALRQPTQAARTVRVDAAHALAECTGFFTVDGRRPDAWAPVSGLYPCGEAVDEPGWVRIHANFAHHRDGALALLGLPPGEHTTADQVRAALRHWRALDVEAQAAARGLVIAAMRTRDEWLAHPQQAVVAAQPLVAVTALDAERPAPPLAWPALADGAPPLQGLRVLDLTRILAGPVAARTLAAHGAEVLMINGPHLPNIEAIADVSRGKRSALLDLRTAGGRDGLHALAAGAHVFLQGYRPGSFDALGFSAQSLARERPGLVVASLSAYGRDGPWADRRGFDSLVQTVSGMNHAEAQAFGQHKPRALPVQILDYCAGFLLAFGIQAALRRQQLAGGSWHVQVNLARVAEWLWQLGPRDVRRPDAAIGQGSLAPHLETLDSGFGRLRAVRHSGVIAGIAPSWPHPSAPPGSSRAEWES
jgi:crotonobetainyl-CoA:carnitine CoA-transferase CaiB-like acyl-CoA transferase